MPKDVWRNLISDIPLDFSDQTSEVITRDIEMRIFPNLMNAVINQEPPGKAKGALSEIRNLITAKKVPLYFPKEDEDFPSDDLRHTLQLRRHPVTSEQASGRIGLRIFVFPSSFSHLVSTDDSIQSIERVRQVMYDVFNEYSQLVAQKKFHPGDSPVQ